MSALDGFDIPSTVLRHFDLTSTPWSAATVDRIQRRRRTYPEGMLFIDRLLDVGRLDGQALYPPATPAAVRRLLASIDGCDMNRLHQDCLYYYLLKDCDARPPTSQTGQDDDMAGNDRAGEVASRAAGFARRRCLPKTWTVLMDGYWALDNGDWQVAVKNLSSPSLPDLNFLPAILSVLATHIPAADLAASLIHQLLTTMERPLTTPEEREIKLLALSRAAGLLAAFSWIRQHEDPMDRTSLRESVWCWALGAPKTSLGADKPEIQTSALRELLHLPLSDEETEHLVHFLSHPPRSISPQALSVLHDLVFLRLVHQGRYAEVIQLDKDLAGSGGKDEDRQRRREMIREFISILPQVQRRALLADSELRVAEKDKEQVDVNGSISAEAPDVEMPTSWLATNGFGAAETVAEAPVLPSAVLDPGRRTPLAMPRPQALPRAGDSIRPASPFTGPPRFASSSSFGLGLPGSPVSPAARIASNSPFALRHASTASNRTPSMPRPPRRIVNDDADPAVVLRSTRSARVTPATTVEPASPLARLAPQADTSAEPQTAATAEHTKPEHPAEHLAVAQTSPTLRRSTRRAVSGASQSTDAPAEQHKTPPPPSPQTRRRSTRHTPGPPTGPSGLPGSFPETVPEDAVPDIQPTPRRPANARPPPSSSRRRMTRSASVASLAEADGEQTPAPKRTRKTGESRASSLAPTEPEEAGQSVRRSSRRGTSVRQSDRGSPTPSAGVKSAAAKERSRAPTQGSTSRSSRAKKA